MLAMVVGIGGLSQSNPFNTLSSSFCPMYTIPQIIICANKKLKAKIITKRLFDR